jgi:Flp pilus assembly protein TadB
VIWRRNGTGSDRSVQPSPTDAVDGKGRPTPSRKQAEAERKERLKASSSGESRKATASRTAAARTTRSSRAETRKRIIAGDESVLAPRDRGPERRYARDLVDERHTVGEYFLYIAIAILVLGLIRVGPIAVLAQGLLVLVVVALVVDSTLTYRRVTRAVAEKFPNSTVQSIGRYAMMRGMVTRRMRVPGPQVKRRARGTGR